MRRKETDRREALRCKKGLRKRTAEELGGLYASSIRSLKSEGASDGERRLARVRLGATFHKEYAYKASLREGEAKQTLLLAEWDLKRISNWPETAEDVGDAYYADGVAKGLW